MLRESLMAKSELRDRGFRWRSHEISRIEGLSDAVFAFAITLLIVSLEVPRTFSELYETMRGFLPFAVSFAMLFQIWHAQFTWFRRYGLQDAVTMVLNAGLLFVVLFYVYPLKFLFTYLLNVWMGGDGMARMPDGRMEPMLRGHDAYLMMVIYDAGFIAVFAVFVLLYLHALRKAGELELTPEERTRTVERLGANVCFVAIGSASLAVVLIGGPRAAGWAGLVYMSIAPVISIYYAISGRHQRRKIAASSR